MSSELEDVFRTCLSEHPSHPLDRRLEDALTTFELEDRSLTREEILAGMELVSHEPALISRVSTDRILRALTLSLWWRKGGDEILDLAAPAHQDLVRRLLALLADAD